MSTSERYRELRSGYYRRVELGAMAALGIHAIVFALAPPYVPRPFHLPPQQPMRLVEVGSGSAGGPSLREAPGVEAVGARPLPAGATAVQSEQLEPAPAARPAGPAPGSPGAGGPGGGAGGAGSGAVGDLPPVFYSYDSAPQIVRRVEPDYPLLARVKGEEGTVVINVNVGADGRILRAWVAQSTASEALAAAAIDAIYQFEFLPGKQGEYPVKCTVAIPFHFSLKRTS